MYIDRRYRFRRRRSPWAAILLLFILVGAGYLVFTRTDWLPANPLISRLPSPTPTRSALSFLAEAEDLYRAGKFGGAIAAYAHLAQLEPSNDEAYAWQARLQVLSGRAGDAVILAQKAVNIKESAFNLGVLAMAYDWNNQYPEAMDNGLKAVDKDPLLAEAHAFLAEVYADKTNWDRALVEGQAGVKLNPKSAIAQRNLGYVLERQGRFEEAIAAYEQAAQIEPQLGYIYVGLGNCYLAKGQDEQALAQFQKAAAANPDNPAIFDQVG